MAPPTEGGGDGLPMEEDTRMDDDKSEKKEVSQPADTGLTEETKEGAFMVVGTVEKTWTLLKKLKEKLKMPEVELMRPGPWAQRTWLAAVPSSPLLELAIAAGGGRQVGHSKRGRLRRELAF